MMFSKDFFWGTATSSYQIEGAHDLEGRVPSIWDTFCNQPGKVYLEQNGNRACQHYDHWKDDVALMKKLGVNAYRFSIAWPRIYSAPGQINQSGLEFYSRLIDTLLENGIEPFVTMYHWDLPQFIQDRGGWAKRETSEFFRDYAYTLTQHFADRVKFWTTLNEPSVAVFAGHFWGFHAPGLNSPEISLQALHHFLLGHGMAVQAIRDSFNVQLGIALNFSAVFPKDPLSPLDQQAAKLYDTYLYKSFLDALFHKKYPSEMNMHVKAQDLEIIGQPLDFVGINYYTTSRVTFDANVPLFQARGVSAEANSYSNIWEFYPEGLSQVIKRVAEYTSQPIYILENGTSLDETENDQGRIDYLKAHLHEVEKCIKDGIDIRGYFVWSLMDNFEWAMGYSKRFGLYYVDFETLERRPKASAKWYASFIKKQS